MSAILSRALEQGLGCKVDSLQAVSGGDIHQAFRAELADGRPVFVKTHPHAQAGMFLREAEGLAWLREGGARVPTVLAVRDESPRLLALAWVQSAPRSRDFDHQLGVMLARLHSATLPEFGGPGDNFIGPLPQDNRTTDSWVQLYGERRLLPMAHRAYERGALSTAQRADIEQLVTRLPECAGPPEPPARLHGDLWSGNVLSDARGAPILIDPACYAGHREIDLAMLALFGHVSDELLAAYESHSPLSPGFSERVALYQLYPLLVHAVLFGGGYGGQAGAVARRYL